MVQLTLAPCVSSAVKGDVLGGRSGSKMLMIWGCGFFWQKSILRGSGTGPLSFTSERIRRRVPVPVASGEPKRKYIGNTTAQEHSWSSTASNQTKGQSWLGSSEIHHQAPPSPSQGIFTSGQAALQYAIPHFNNNYSSYSSHQGQAPYSFARTFMHPLNLNHSKNSSLPPYQFSLSELLWL